MPKLLFCDIESTGVGPLDRLCELALIIEDSESLILSQELVKSAKKISIEAMALHHITNEMVSNSKACDETIPFRQLNELNGEENILITHQSKFVLEMLAKEGFALKLPCIDLQRCTRALIPECGQFDLQFLRYELKLYKKEQALADKLSIPLSAHRAASDALHIKLLYASLLEYATLSELISMSEKPLLLPIMEFGKYKGQYLEEIARKDPAYLAWVLQGVEDLDDDLRYSIEYVMKGV